ncbi:MAG TPA: FAD-binding oxidoreductase [Acidimicrobiales bacterium]|nr:FAD-binding oxidoreductase [Acidimicrobiales bacterium]
MPRKSGRPGASGAGAVRSELTGWGRTPATAADVVHAVHPDIVDGVVSGTMAGGDRPDRGLIARGLGRSYGDAAQNAGGTVVDATWLDAVHHVDLEAGLLTVGAGVSLETLMERFVPLGWFVPVTPGTRLVTVGGAIAADIHGKNHHRDGSFCSHVTAMTLVTPTGTWDISAASHPDLFWATAGGMGLTGVVTRATLQMIPVESSYMLVDTERASDLDDAMSRMVSGDDGYRYSVTWIDCQSTGKNLGRSVLTRGDHARLDELPDALRRAPDKARRFVPKTLVNVPITPPSGLLNPLTVGAFNEFWFRKAPKFQVDKPQHMTGFFHPLDGVGAWNRLYGKRGFLQYQFVVADRHAETVRRIIEQLTELKLASFLAVLKRFGPGDPGPLSFPMPGWTLALDLPVGYDQLDRLLDGFDEQVAEVGGRVYLAKDSRVAPAMFERMYPELDAWRAVRDRVDPEGVLQSDLSRRLGLTGDSAGTTERARPTTTATSPSANSKTTAGAETAAKKATATRTTAKKATATRTTAKKASAKKAPAKKSTAKRASAATQATATKAGADAGQPAPTDGASGAETGRGRTDA